MLLPVAFVFQLTLLMRMGRTASIKIQAICLLDMFILCAQSRTQGKRDFHANTKTILVYAHPHHSTKKQLQLCHCFEK